MPELIKKGCKNNRICKFCGSTVSFKADEILEKEVYLSQFNSKFEKYIICPECKYPILVNDNETKREESIYF